ncbi:MAG: hypothetical protein JXB14_05385 [Candidatus Altiarchaeota archaeon]|nr:hypothetical protein [Candidatus Altiarchaeota archaeon]
MPNTRNRRNQLVEEALEDTICLKCPMLGVCKMQEPTDSEFWTDCAHFRDREDKEEAKKMLALQKQGRLKWQQKEVLGWDGSKKFVSMLPVFTSKKRGYIAKNLEFLSEDEGTLRFTGQMLE